MFHYLDMSDKALPNQTGLPQLNVVIICEDLASGKYAKELQDHLLLSLGSKIDLVPEVWTFRALQHPELQELAAHEIAGANIILFSTRGDTAVPLSIKAWLEIWLAKPDRPRALVALFGPARNSDQAGATRLYLEEIASKGRLDFFAPSVQKPAAARRPLCERGSEGRLRLRERRSAS